VALQRVVHRHQPYHYLHMSLCMRRALPL
jgi:hypothetical protein